MSEAEEIVNNLGCLEDLSSPTVRVTEEKSVVDQENQPIKVDLPDLLGDILLASFDQ